MPTAIKRSSARQSLIVAYIDLILANFVSAADEAAIEIPAGGVIVFGGVTVDVVFNSTTSDVLDVGDSGSENRYLNDLSLQALGHTALVPTGYVYTAPTLITFRWVSGGGTPTTGAARAMIAYYKRGRADLGNQGLDYGSRLA